VVGATGVDRVVAGVLGSTVACSITVGGGAWVVVGAGATARAAGCGVGAALDCVPEAVAGVFL
jgi:hypothetical protein